MGVPSGIHIQKVRPLRLAFFVVMTFLTLIVKKSISINPAITQFVRFIVFMPN